MDVFLTTLQRSEFHEFQPIKEWILMQSEWTEPTVHTHPLLAALL